MKKIRERAPKIEKSSEVGEGMTVVESVAAPSSSPKDPAVEGIACVVIDWLKCRGCSQCEHACSLFHHGVINRELSAIRVHEYFPGPMTFPITCSYCREEFRACVEACPLDPKVITYDEEDFVLKIDKQRCLGHRCARCLEACWGKAINFHPPDHDYAIVCDLCIKDGKREPQCVKACPFDVLTFLANPQLIHGGGQGLKWHPKEIASLLADRFLPVTPEKKMKLPEELGL